jgi:hypothetical protein
MHGLVAAAIGGAVSTLMVALADPSAIKFDEQGLRHMGQVAGGGAFVTMLAYLKQSPLPSKDCADQCDAPKK